MLPEWKPHHDRCGRPAVGTTPRDGYEQQEAPKCKNKNHLGILPDRIPHSVVSFLAQKYGLRGIDTRLPHHYLEIMIILFTDLDGTLLDESAYSRIPPGRP